MKNLFFIIFVILFTSAFSQNKNQTDSILTDSRDGQKYKIVKIGNQIWMDENIRYVSPGSASWTHNPKFDKEYGRYYHSDSLNNVCPPNWHIPNNSEWNILLRYLGNNLENAGGKLKSTLNWDSPNIGASNDVKFNAIPARCWDVQPNTFYLMGINATFWVNPHATKKKVEYVIR